LGVSGRVSALEWALANVMYSVSSGEAFPSMAFARCLVTASNFEEILAFAPELGGTRGRKVSCRKVS
jgi:hypothetical protein